MEENKNYENEALVEQEEQNAFDINAIITMLVLNWQWFVLSVIISLGIAMVYLRYTTPQHQAFAKIMIKDDESNNRRPSSMMNANAASLGILSASNGIDNEMEILKSRSIAEQTVYRMKLYADYQMKGRIKYVPVYQKQPFNVDMDSVHLYELPSAILMEVERNKEGYHVTGEYRVEEAPRVPVYIDETIAKLPATINTKVGTVMLTPNENPELKVGGKMKIALMSPKRAAYSWVNALSVQQTSKMTTIARLGLVDAIPARAIDYLNELVITYNSKANEDKNLITKHTDEFIASRLDKIGHELGLTESDIETYKKQNRLVELKLDATQALQNQNTLRGKLEEAELEIALIDELIKYINENVGQYRPLPTNIGLTDASTSGLITLYNQLSNERTRLLLSASENNPNVKQVTAQLEELTTTVKSGLAQSRANLDMKRKSLARQYGNYSSQVSQTPSNEHTLAKFARQQDVMQSLFMMLLQKREENAIQQAATADKGELIDEPAYGGKVSPRGSIILLAALILGLAIPFGIIYVLNFFRYKIEGHDDVARLTTLPIIADVAIASETAKTKADIVVHENTNNQMEEIFRGMRTNLQFMLKENEKVVIFTSSTSGEGKTFNAANLAVSFALLDKKVIIVGLDIRKPRLAELFEINDRHHGITPLLAQSNPTWEDVKGQIVESGINKNLDLLLAGPIPPNPAELIARPSLDTIVSHLRDNYDYVIIDTAPVGLVTDTLQIGRVADATIFMCRADYTPKESFGLINSLAKDKKLPNMSIVINGIDMSKKKYGYYYGYGKYGKYGKYGRYGSYGKYGSGSYGNYGAGYGNYSNSHYGDKNDTSIKR
jgi:capsular exopolysaccharide synthesis family protein